MADQNFAAERLLAFCDEYALAGMKPELKDACIDGMHKQFMELYAYTRGLEMELTGVKPHG